MIIQDLNPENIKIRLLQLKTEFNMESNCQTTKKIQINTTKQLFYNSFYKALDKIKDKTILKRIESTNQKAELAQGQI